jgi:hypothetical protein
VPRLYRGNVALKPINLTKERLSRHRGCTFIYFESPAINSRFANSDWSVELLDRLFHQAGCLCRILSQAPLRAVSLMMRSISARVSSFANSPAIAVARER